MIEWQEHPLEGQPAEFRHLGTVQEIAEKVDLGGSGLTVHPDGFVEYDCTECGEWSLERVDEPCAHHGECLSCYLASGEQATLASSADADRGPIPPEVPWSEMRCYRCGSCKGICISWEDSPCSQADECYSCHRVPDLSQPVSPTAASEGEGGEASTGAGSPRPVGAAECPEAAPEPPCAERGLAPDRAARAHPPSEAKGERDGGAERLVESFNGDGAPPNWRERQEGQR